MDHHPDEAVPPDSVKLQDGRVIKKTERAFRLHKPEGFDNLEIALDGTKYSRDASGALRRLGKKKGRKH